MRSAAATVALFAVALAGCSAETDPASNVTYDGATLHGVLRWDGGEGPGTVWWQYRRVGTLQWLEQGERWSWPRMPEPGWTPVAKTLTGLADGTSYEYRVCVKADVAPLVACYDRNGSLSAGAWDRFTTTSHPTATPRSAFAFNNSIGVATHPTYFDTVHGEEAEIARRIANAEIRHVRNGMAISADARWNEIVWSNMRAWADHGVVSSWGVDRCVVTHRADHTVRMYLDRIAEIDANLSSAVEGTNEVNYFCAIDWVERERAYVAHLYQEVRGHPDPVISSLPVIGPSFAYSGGPEAIGDISQWIDRGNTHPYSGCTSPTPQHVQRYAIDSYVPAGGSKPVIVTEVGFHTAVNTREPGAQPPCDERTGGIYTLRTVLEHFKLGIERSYLYEAIDLWPDPERDQSEWNFGILRNDFSAKPAYTYLRNLLATTGSAATTALAPLELNVEQGPADLRTLLLRQADGDYVLALWRHASVWNRDTRVPVAVSPAQVRLSVPTASSVGTVEPHRGTVETPLTLTNRRVTLDVAGDAVLLVIR